MHTFFSKNPLNLGSLMLSALLMLSACGGGETPPETDLGVVRDDIGLPDIGVRDDSGLRPDGAIGDDASIADASTGDAGGECATAVEAGTCATAGAFCGGPCTDPCSFCNVLRCESGRWMRLEAFPDPTCAMTFPCDTAGLRCDRGTEFCSIARSDVAGVPDTITCEPTSCTPVTCACFPATAGRTCADDADGAVTVTYLGG